MATVSEAYALAEKYQRAGQFQYAEQICRQIVEAVPDHADAWNMLGILAYQAEDFIKAAEHVTRAVAARPDDPGLRNNLGVMYYSQGKLVQALASYQEALRRDPGSADLYNNIGNVLKDQGKVDEAVASYRRALQIRPDHSDAHNNLGNAYKDMGRYADAAASYRTAVRLRPDFPQAHSNLGTALKELGSYQEAEACYREALRLRPGFAEVHTNLGVVLQDQGKVAEAVGCFREALRLRPNYADAHNNLGIALAEQGKVDEAVACCQQALRLNPNLALAYYSLGALASQGGYKLSQSELDRIKELLASGKLTTDDASRLHFALAAVHDKLGSIDEAFAHYRAGNDLHQRYFRERGIPFNPDRHRRLVDDLVATFDKDFFNRFGPFGLDTELPIFIVGMPRSGTTLVEQILCSHPRVVGCGELRDIPELVARLPETLRTPDKYPACLSRLDGPALRALAMTQLQRLAVRGGQAARVIDKQLRNRLHVGMICTLFPRARIIHCLRDPVDTCWSCFQQHFDALNFTSSFEDLGFYYRQYQRLMAHWRQVLPTRMFEVSYEGLVTDPEGISRELIAFCGLDWDDRCLSFHENPRAIQTASALQVRRPVYRSSVGRWKRYEAHLKPLVAALAGGQAGPGPAAAVNASAASSPLASPSPSHRNPQTTRT